MKPICNALILALVCGVNLCGSPALATVLDYVTFYVATNGNNNWSGKIPAPNTQRTDGPFADVWGARDRLRSLKATNVLAKGGTVFVRDGKYVFQKALYLEAQDSGMTNAPITFEAFASEHPVLRGGPEVTNFTRWKDNIWQADLAKQDLTNAVFKQLYWNGQTMPLARYPNLTGNAFHGEAWAYAEGTVIPNYQDIPGEDSLSFNCKAVDLRGWSQAADAEVFVLPRYNWVSDICSVKAVDTLTRKVTLTKAAAFTIRPGDRYYVRNAIEELDAPGEWYLDKRAWILYFWPPLPTTNISVVVPQVPWILLYLNPGTSHVTWRGFTMECCYGPVAILKNTTNCLIGGNTIRNCAYDSYAAVTVLGGSSNSVIGNDISQVGGYGIWLEGGKVQTLSAAGNAADNNYIHHVALDHKSASGICVRGVGQRVSHNLIHDLPRSAVDLRGNKHVIEFNHFRHVCLETEDCGAVYTAGLDWLSPRGTEIRFNYIHDVFGYGRNDRNEWQTPYFAWGIYLDDNSGGADVIGNIVARTARACLHLHNGRDNLITGNVLVEGGLNMIEYNGWTAQTALWRQYLPSMSSNYDAVATSPDWRGMRGMDVHPTNAALANGFIMAGNVCRNNILCYTNQATGLFKFQNVAYDHYTSESNLVWHGGFPLGTTEIFNGRTNSLVNGWGVWQAIGFDTNSVIADPLFVDPSADNYRLNAGSPAAGIGFSLIAIEKIGPYQDPTRASWPVLEAHGAREGLARPSKPEQLEQVR